MNALVQLLNLRGEQFVGLAWPMLWQSSVLIAVLFALDVALRRRVRATVRYALWMLVLVKLLLPTSLSLPTSPGYWLPSPTVLDAALTIEPLREAELRQQWTPVEALEPTLAPAVSASHITEQIPSTTASPPISPAPLTPIHWPASVALSWLFGAAALLVLAILRGRVAWRMVADASEAPPDTCALLAECAGRLGVRSRLRVLLTDTVATPVVCGLFRPVILLPFALPGRLDAEQLRAVLLHELAHVRRGDLWVSHLQTALQILHFFNPLLWLANGRIRRVREEAVDEMVLVALGDRAEMYPETLLSLAKRAVQPRRLAFGLIGILESKSSLSQRIRLMLLRPWPKTAQLGFKGIIALLLLAVTLLPMSCAHRKPSSVEFGALEHDSSLSMRTEDSDAGGRQGIWSKLNGIILENIEFTNAPLNDVVSRLAQESRRLDPTRTGVHFAVSPYTDANTLANLDEVRVTLRVQRVTLLEALNAVLSAAQGRIRYVLEDYSVLLKPGNRLPVLPMQTVHFKMDNNAIWRNLDGDSKRAGMVTAQQTSHTEFGSADFGSPDLNSAESLTSSQSTVFLTALRHYFLACGIDLRLPKAISLDSRAMIVVTATQEELDFVEAEFSDNLDKARPFLRVDEAGRCWFNGRGLSYDEFVRAIQGIRPDFDGNTYFRFAESAACRSLVQRLVRTCAGLGIRPVFIPEPAPRIGTAGIRRKLDSIILEEVKFDHPLAEVVRWLHNETRSRDPESMGIKFIVARHADTPVARTLPPIKATTGDSDASGGAFPVGGVAIPGTPDPSTGLPLTVASTAQTEMPDLADIPIKLRMTNVPLIKVLDAIVKASEQPIQYIAEDYDVLFTAKPKQTQPRYTKFFKVDPDAIRQWLDQDTNPPGTFRKGERSPPSQSEREATLVTRFLAALGLNFAPPSSMFFERGLLMVHATIEEFDKVEDGLYEMNLSLQAAEAALAPSVSSRTSATGESGFPGPRIDERGRYWLGGRELTLKELARAMPTIQANSNRTINISVADHAPANAVTEFARLCNQMGIVALVVRDSSSGSAATNSPALYTKFYKVEPSSFAQALAGKHGDNSTNSPSPQFYKWVRDLFASMGVDFAPPRAVFFNDRSGQLMVRATLEELDLIENALAVLSTPPPMVKIEARFVKVRQGQARALGFTWYSGTNVIARSTNGAAIDGTLAEQKPQSSFLGILTDPQFRVTLQALEKRDGTDIVVAPPVTTLSRRAARIEINSSTNIVMQGQSQTIQVGPSADVLAEVSEDGFSIELNVGAAVVELLGYDDSSTLPLPRLRVRKLVTTTARVWDGQTLVLTNPVDVNGNPAEGPGEKLLLYVKATILDPSGNPIHTDADMPFRTNSIPPQPSQGTR